MFCGTLGSAEPLLKSTEIDINIAFFSCVFACERIVITSFICFLILCHLRVDFLVFHSVFVLFMLCSSSVASEPRLV